MEENNDIFLAGGDALVYLAEPMYKKYSTKWFLGNSFRTYVSYDVLFSPCAQLYTFLMNSPPFLQLRTYLMDGLFLNQKQITTFQYRIHWNINIQKKFK